MYTKYSYLSGLTQANLLADVVKLLTGETDKNQLSENCDKANTEILTAYDVAGWTVHDATAGVNAVVLKAPCDGDPNQFKYVEINTNTAGYLYTGLYESWNATTHVGTNLVGSSKMTTACQRYNSAGAGVFYFSVSEHRMLVYGISAVGTGVAGQGNYSTAGSISGILETDRGYTWCGVGQGLVPVGYFSGAQHFTMPRFKSTDGTVRVWDYSAWVALTVPLVDFGGNQRAFSVGSGAPMAAGFAFPIVPIFAVPLNLVSPPVSGFSVTGLFASLGGYANILDETLFDGKQRVCWPGSSTGIGHAKFIIPKG